MTTQTEDVAAWNAKKLLDAALAALPEGARILLLSHENHLVLRVCAAMISMAQLETMRLLLMEIQQTMQRVAVDTNPR